MEKILYALENSPFILEDGTSLRIDIAIGSHSIFFGEQREPRPPVDGEVLEYLLRKADADMYRHKKLSRSPDPAPPSASFGATASDILAAPPVTV